jgi:hypothetical protein
MRPIGLLRHLIQTKRQVKVERIEKWLWGDAIRDGLMQLPFPWHARFAAKNQSRP